MPDVLAIDPGTERSAWVLFSGWGAEERGIEQNEVIVEHIIPTYVQVAQIGTVEMVESYGLPVGREVFETCVWIGRFAATWDRLAEGEPCRLVGRKDIKMHHCNQLRKVNDSVLRQVMIDRFGPGRQKAIGTKANQGPCYGLKRDLWQALALATAVWDWEQIGGDPETPPA